MYLQEGTGVDVGARLALFLPVITRSLAMRERAVTIMKSKTRKFNKNCGKHKLKHSYHRSRDKVRNFF